MSGLELVIFDCDGVLVDSERLAIRTEAQVLACLGWPLSEQEIVERFVGRSAEHMHHEIENHLGRSVDWDREFETRYREVFARELCPVAGVESALDRIDVPICVASSGTHAKINFSLGVTGLAGRFDGRIFSVEDVEHGKPAPDLFFYAAEQMGRDPSACAVVEDSMSGVKAGIAAGMRVFGFAGGVTSASQLSLDGVQVFNQMAELPDLLLIDE
ncbi:MAG: HAD family hydrolase [Acidimicrobiales bacterium]